MVNLITDHIDIWTAAQIQKINGVGRGNHTANHSLHGIKKLRELILDLAMRGKLVPQDPNDEPSNILLERITKEKTRLNKEGKIKKQEPLSEITDEDKPFELAESWVWIRLGSSGIGSTGTTPSTSNPKYYDGEIPFIGPGQISREGDITEPDKTLTMEGCEYSTMAELGDILMVCIGGSIGKSAIARSKIAFNQQINCIRPLIVDSVFLNVAMKAPHFQAAILDTATGSATPIINRSKWEELLIPLPPLPEQHRIVAKVDELMAMCDQLEKQQTGSNAAHQALVETLLSTLTSATNQDEFVETWQRIANHFDILFTTKQSIDQLKQTILQLAIMGKLAPQDSNDEPASVLLEKIKYSLCHEKTIKGIVKLKRDKSTADPVKHHFAIPENWIWCELQEISIFTNGKAHEQYVTKESKYILINSRFVSTSGEIKKYATERLTPLERGDIAIVMSDVPDGRAIVRCYLVKQDEKYTLNQRIGCISSSKEMNKEYLMLVLDRNKYYLQYDDGQKQTNLKKIQIMSCPIPLPPLAEQNRIVAKVDELMALCDTLKARINDAQTTQIQLADAIVVQAAS